MTSVGVSMAATPHACNQCTLFFTDQKTQREHYKTEFHLYNMKRRVAGLDPIEQEVFDAYMNRLKEEEAFQTPGSEAHKKKIKKKSSSGRSVVSTPIEDALTCLFDGHQSASVEANLEYMRKNFSFFIPSAEYLVDPEGLLRTLGEKISQGHLCIYCDRQFGSIEGVRGHMLDLNHTRIGTDTDDLLDDIEDFYAYPDAPESPPGLIQEDGTLTVASGTKIPRELAYIYKQRHSNKAQEAEVDSFLDLKGKYLQILGGESAAGQGALARLPVYQLKRMAQQAHRDKHSAMKIQIRTEIKRHRTAAMQHCRGQIVEMYSYGMSVFYGGITSAALMRRAHREEVDRRLGVCGLIPSNGVREEEPMGLSASVPTHAEEHPIDDEAEERFNVQRVSEAEEIRRYFAPFDPEARAPAEDLFTAPVSASSRQITLED